MAIKFRHATSIVTEWHATRSSMDVTDTYRVRNLGRGRWLVVREDDGYRWTLSTSRLQWFFRGYVLESLYEGPYEEISYTVE